MALRNYFSKLFALRIKNGLTFNNLIVVLVNCIKRAKIFDIKYDPSISSLGHWVYYEWQS